MTNSLSSFGAVWQPAVVGLADMGVPIETRKNPLRRWQEAREMRRALREESPDEKLSGSCLVSFAAGAIRGDKTLHSHSERVAVASLRLGRRIGLTSSQLHTLHLAALLHDCGKLALDPKILNKLDPLDEAEWAQIKTHPRRGESLLTRLPFVRDALPAVRFHHERWDGSGYPDGLKGEEIPLAARIIGLCDAYDAMTHARPYHSPMAVEAARDVVRNESGSHFDPMLVSAFLAPKAAATLFFSSHPARVAARHFA